MGEDYYFVEPRIVENVETALVDHGGSMTLRRGKRSRLRREPWIGVDGGASQVVLKAFHQRRRRSDLTVQVGHFRSLSLSLSRGKYQQK